MNVMKQTNRTILFDVVNPEKYDLLNLMAGIDVSDKSLTDEKLREIHSTLLVKSFDEFLYKFAPTIYSYFDGESNRMMYTLERPVGVPAQLIKEIVINKNNQFLKTFISLIEGKRTSNITNAGFNYEEMLTTLSPQKTLRDMKRLSKDINYIATESLKLESDSPAKLKKLKQLSTKVVETEQFYSEFPTQIALMLGTIRENLNMLALAEKSGGAKVVPALPSFGEKGELLKLEVSAQAQDTPLLTGSSEATKLLVSEIEDRYTSIEAARTAAVVGQDNVPAASSLMKELVVSAFTDKMSEALAVMEVDQKVELYNNYSALYNSWQKDFIKVAKPIFERLLGVKTFFDSYTPKTKGMAPALLVTNVCVEDLAEHDNLEKLKLYLESVNNKTDYTDTIWFGILPRVEMSIARAFDDTDLEMTPDFAQKWGYDGEFDLDEDRYFNSITSMQMLLEGIRKYKIQTFFGFQTGEDTTFAKMASVGAEAYIEKAEQISGTPYDEFAIACFPNFTIVPEDKSRVVTSQRAHLSDSGGISFPEELQNDVKFWMKGVYIGAEYAAAGLVAACQCPQYLATYFKKVQKDFPGVRFDLEEDDNALRLPSLFAKEIAGFTNTVREQIEQSRFGFVFTSDNHVLDGKVIGGVHVLGARSMHQDRRAYRSIFQTTRRTYIERMMAAQLKNKDEKSIKAYFAPGGQISEWQRFGDWKNSIIRDGEVVALNQINDGFCDIVIESKGLSETFTINVSETE